jgi:hypothetical protein
MGLDDGRGQKTRPTDPASEDALVLADEIQDTGYLIERALDEARSGQFRPIA